MIKTHDLNLNIKPYEDILYGTKRIELRLNYPSRKDIKVNDYIRFKTREGIESNRYNDNNYILTKVINIYHFKDFKELYENIDLKSLGYKANELDNASYKDMNQYYTNEQIKMYQVVAFEFEIIEVK